MRRASSDSARERLGGVVKFGEGGGEEVLWRGREVGEVAGVDDAEDELDLFEGGVERS